MVGGLWCFDGDGCCVLTEPGGGGGGIGVWGEALFGVDVLIDEVLFGEAKSDEEEGFEHELDADEEGVFVVGPAVLDDDGNGGEEFSIVDEPKAPG